jgi:hypothetical protein
MGIFNIFKKVTAFDRKCTWIFGVENIDRDGDCYGCGKEII